MNRMSRWGCHRPLRVLVLLSVALAAAAPGGAESAACSKVFLLRLHDRAVKVSDDDRAFFNLVHLCQDAGAGEAELYSAGIDLRSVQSYLHLSPGGASSFDDLRRWAGGHCAEYRGASAAARLAAIVRTLARADGLGNERRVYETCAGQTAGLSCQAWTDSANERLVGLLLAWKPAPGAAAGPLVEEAAIGGAVAPDEALETTAPGNLPVRIGSLVGRQVTETGVLRSFLRLDPAGETTVKIATNAGPCVVDKVAAGGPERRPYTVDSVQETQKVDRKQDETNARLHGEILFWVRNLPRWFDKLRSDGKLGRDEGVRDLVPFFDGIALSGVHPTNPEALAEPDGSDDYRSLRFVLERNESNAPAWSRLLNEPRPKRRIGASVGFADGREMPTAVLTDAKEADRKLELIIIPTGRFRFGFGLIAGALVVFLYLAAKTDIIRDSNAPLRPDGRRPFSLGRSQMAFWFFLVAAAYFLLWLITGDTDTVTPSVLALIGISAGTALSASLVDGSKEGEGGPDRYVAAVDLAAERQEIRKALQGDLGAVRDELRKVREARAAIDAADEEALKDNARRQKIWRERAALLQQQLDFFSWPPWRRFLNDLLGDHGVISFHRFQIAVWTLVLAIIFGYKVWHELSMPEFSATLLGIMGISAGTYVGFKFQDAKD